jgi:glycosyltransferase involved in cell wall biosynthesis
VSEPRVRVYGYATGEASFSQVTRGMCRTLRSTGEFAGLWPIDREYSVDDPEGAQGATAPVSLNLGSPMGLMHAHRMGSHQSHWLLLAPNSEGLPYGMMDSLLKASDVLPHGMLTGGLLAPSGWAASVLRRAVPDTVPVVVAPHGVTPEVHRMDRKARDAARHSFRHGQFDVLHMTSSEAERKSTKNLLRAWKQAKLDGFIPKSARLFVMMNPRHMSKLRWWCADLGLSADDVVMSPGLAYDQADVAAMYGSMHAVCQPSRGEGFGMVPLEALACGVPVIATACTGHAEFLGNRPPGAVIVEHGENAPMDDFPGSVAPTVTWAAIRDSLAATFAYWESISAHAEQNAEAVSAEWSWENKNVPAIRRMLQEAEKHVR